MESPTAIVAVSEDGRGFLVKWLNPEAWQIEDFHTYDVIEDQTFEGVSPGLHYADLIASQCGGSRCRGYPCPGDCFESYWELRDEAYSSEELRSPSRLNQEHGSTATEIEYEQDK